MTTKTSTEFKPKEYETLSSFIEKEYDYKISHKAFFIGFKHRIKVEFLKSFIV